MHVNKILALSTVFPNPSEPQLGIFLLHRCRHMAALSELKVVAPVPVICYRLLTQRVGNSAIPWNGVCHCERLVNSAV